MAKDIPDFNEKDIILLGKMLKRSMYSIELMNNPKKILDELENPTSRYRKYLLAEVPLQELPIYLARNVKQEKVVANWRLTIGK